MSVQFQSPQVARDIESIARRMEFHHCACRGDVAIDCVRGGDAGTVWLSPAARLQRPVRRQSSEPLFVADATHSAPQMSKHKTKATRGA